jgi:hypothetical protein
VHGGHILLVFNVLLFPFQVLYSLLGCVRSEYSGNHLISDITAFSRTVSTHFATCGVSTHVKTVGMLEKSFKAFLPKDSPLLLRKKWSEIKYEDEYPVSSVKDPPYLIFYVMKRF